MFVIFHFVYKGQTWIFGCSSQQFLYSQIQLTLYKCLRLGIMLVYSFKLNTIPLASGEQLSIALECSSQCIKAISTSSTAYGQRESSQRRMVGSTMTTLTTRYKKGLDRSILGISFILYRENNSSVKLIQCLNRMKY